MHQRSLFVSQETESPVASTPPAGGAGLSLAELLEEYYFPCNQQLRRESSRAELRSFVRTFAKYLERPAQLSDLNRVTAGRFLAWARDVRQVSDMTRNKYAGQMLALWNFAFDEELTSERLPKKRRMMTREDAPIAECYSIAEMELILEAAGRQGGRICGVFANDWWLSLLLTIYDTGWRIGAVLQLTPQHLDVERSLLQVKAHEQKDREAQVCRIHPQTLELIVSTEPQTRDLLWPWRHKTGRGHKSLVKAFRRLLKSAGVAWSPAENAKPFHKIRKTTGTYDAMDRGHAAAAESLGHSSVDIFRRYYLDRSKIEPADAARLPRPALPKRQLRLLS